MSRILWKTCLQPPLDSVSYRHRYELYDGDVSIPRAVAFPESEESLVELPDPRAQRALSRSGLLLVKAGLGCREAVAAFVADDPFSVGIYCAMENGPNDFNSAKRMIGTPLEEFAATYKSLRSPKQYFKQLSNVPASQLAIFLGIMGPQNIYQHSKYACKHALDQAEVDLQEGTIKAALLCSAFSLEDPLLSMRTWLSVSPSSVLSEGAAAVVLVANGEYNRWHDDLPASNGHTFGIATDLIKLARRKDDNYRRSGIIPGSRKCDSQGSESEERGIASNNYTYR